MLNFICVCILCNERLKPLYDNVIARYCYCPRDKRTLCLQNKTYTFRITPFANANVSITECVCVFVNVPKVISDNNEAPSPLRQVSHILIQE